MMSKAILCLRQLMISASQSGWLLMLTVTAGLMAAGMTCMSLAALAEEPTVEKPLHVSVSVSNWDELQASLSKYRGKVVVVDLWSTSCDPCLKEFPGLVALQQTHGDKILCISFNCDYIGARTKPVEYYQPQVLEFLIGQKARIVNLISSQPADELFEKLELDSIPAVFVYDHTGKLSQRFDGKYSRPLTNGKGEKSGRPSPPVTTEEEAEDAPKFTYEADINKFVETLINAKP
jgi:thiol-disulfide isomerase/thioredoxin